MQLYESVVWFIVGCFVAGVGGAVGSVAGLWVGWASSVVAGYVAARLSRRLSLIAGVAIVSATVGALTSRGVLVAVLAAFGSVVIPATALLPSLRWRGEFEDRVETSRATRTSRPVQEPAREPSPEPPSALKERDIEAILRLAESDTARFQERLRSLTAEQREQIRIALRARRTG
jgi:hypothetical protein